MTTEDAKLAKMKARMLETSNQKADLTPGKTLEEKKKAKVRDKRLSTYITEQEKEGFLKKIGRKSESDALRELVLKFISEG
jgi:hypothetical protein